MSLRPVKRLVKAKPTLEGAGVHLRRAFGFGKTTDFDPFLLLDDFRNDIPEDYLAGFPWHPHRGIETITYVLAGTVEHGDSMGNRGAIAAGDVQWMTAGSGIIHQEMPKGDQAGRMHGFQLWANLPSSQKMTAPRYQEVKAPDIPEITDDDGTVVRVVCGSFWGKRGPVDGIATDPTYLDVSVWPGKRKTLPVETQSQAFAYVFGGSGKFCNASGPLAVPTYAPSAADPVTSVVFCQAGHCADSSADTSCQLGGGCKVTVEIKFSAVQRGNVSYIVKFFDRCANTTTDLPGGSFTPPGFNIVDITSNPPLPSGAKSAAIVAVTTSPSSAASAPLLLGADTC